MTEEMYTSLQSLSRIHPFDSPNIIDHMIENSEQWQKFYSKTDGEAVPLPGPYINMDVEEVSKKGKAKLFLGLSYIEITYIFTKF